MELPIVCLLTDAQRQSRRMEVLQPFKARVQEIKPLETGYAFRFAADDASWDEVMRVIGLERKCCPFLQFRLTVEPNEGPVWLELTGPRGTKAFLETTLGLPPGPASTGT